VSSLIPRLSLEEMDARLGPHAPSARGTARLSRRAFRCWAHEPLLSFVAFTEHPKKSLPEGLAEVGALSLYLGCWTTTMSASNMSVCR